MDKERVTREAQKLSPTEWVRIGDEAAQIVCVEPFNDGDGPGVFVAYRLPDGAIQSYQAEPDSRFELVSEEERAAARKQADRAQKIADIRALAEWLEANPGAPVSLSCHVQVSPGHEVLPELDVWNSGEQGIAELERVAAIMAAEITHYDDRSEATKTFGHVEYNFIAWHKDGRPAEPDPTGLAYTRADDEPDDPTPVSPARAPMHTGGMTDEGLVDETTYGLIVGDTADDQRANAYAAYERDEAEYLDLPRCPNCHGRHGVAAGCH